MRHKSLTSLKSLNMKVSAIISPAPPKKNVGNSESPKTQMLRFTAYININDAQKKALGFISKFKTEGARELPENMIQPFRV
jgi:hypothetical protein